MASKLRERQQFEAFADAIGQAELKKARDSESPDFVSDEGSSRLGVDLAEMYFDQKTAGGSGARAEETAFTRFRSEVLTALRDRHPNAPVAVAWHWTRNLRGVPGDVVTRAVEELLALVAAALPTLVAGEDCILWEADTPDPKPSALESLLEEVKIRQIPGLKKPEVSAWLLGYAGTELSDEVRALILQKEELRARLYAQQCDRCWLVLVATGLGRESIVDLTEFNVTGLPQTGFERIYVFDEFSRTAKLLTGL